MSLDGATIATNYQRVLARVERACTKAGRDPASVTLIAVSKQQPADAVLAALQAGARHFGENRVQEGVTKIEAVRQLAPLALRDATFHLIGHLQTNKARAAVGSFAILHTIDSERVAEAVSAASTTVTPCLIEVNVAAEESKFGVAPAEVGRLLEVCKSLPGIHIEGLMTVAPIVTKPELARPVFRELAELAKTNGLSTLSMGMTNDFEVAIQEGATHVRVGRAIFGERSWN